MNRLRMRIAKKAERKQSKAQLERETTVATNKWSSAVRAWVSEFQANAGNGARPAFDRLFQTTGQPKST
jgi:hypothetical protein